MKLLFILLLVFGNCSVYVKDKAGLDEIMRRCEVYDIRHSIKGGYRVRCNCK